MSEFEEECYTPNKKKKEKKSRYCLKPEGFYTARCFEGHKIVKPIRCMKCEGCNHHKAVQWTAKNVTKFVEIYPEWFLKQIKTFTLWTLGTNLLDTPTNRLVVGRWFELFRKRVYKRIRYHNKNKDIVWSQFLGRVLESGKKERLHIHFVALGYLEHKYIRSTWSDVTGIKDPNVKFVGKQPWMKYANAFWYVGKYISKGDKAVTMGWMRRKFFHENLDKCNFIKHKHGDDKLYCDNGIEKYIFEGFSVEPRKKAKSEPWTWHNTLKVSITTSKKHYDISKLIRSKLGKVKINIET